MKDNCPVHIMTTRSLTSTVDDGNMIVVTQKTFEHIFDVDVKVFLGQCEDQIYSKKADHIIISRKRTP